MVSLGQGQRKNTRVNSVLVRGKERTRGDQNVLGGIAVFWGYSEIFAPSPNRIMWGQLRTIQGRHLKIRGDWENSNMRGHTKFLVGVEKIEGQGFRGPVIEGCAKGFSYIESFKLFS